MPVMQDKNESQVEEPVMPDDSHDSEERFLDAWMVEHVGKPASEVTAEDIQALPRIERLRWADLKSELGGRLDRHLLHLDQDEADRLRDRGDRFLAETPDDIDEAVPTER